MEFGREIQGLAVVMHIRHNIWRDGTLNRSESPAGPAASLARLPGDSGEMVFGICS